MSVCSGSGPGLFLWPCSPIYLGDRHPGRWTEFHHDRHLLWTVCYGGKNTPCLLTWQLLNKNKCRCASSPFDFDFVKGFPEPALVPFCPGAADPIYRHHPNSARRHFSGCSPSDGNERLPQCTPKHAGQLHFYE